MGFAVLVAVLLFCLVAVIDRGHGSGRVNCTGSGSTAGRGTHCCIGSGDSGNSIFVGQR